MKLFLTLAGVALVAQIAVRRPAAPAPSAIQSRQLSQQQITTVGEPLPVLNAEKGWAPSELLWPMVVQNDDPYIRDFAVRAIGRLEDPANVRPLLAMAAQPAGDYGPYFRRAIAQSLNGFDPSRDPALIDDVAKYLRRMILFDSPPRDFVVDPEPAGMVRYQTPQQVHAVEAAVLVMLERFQIDTRRLVEYSAGARALESLARANSRVTRFDPETIRRLARMTTNTWPNDKPVVRRAAFAALASVQAIDVDTERRALKDDDDGVRRLATVALAGSGGGLEGDERLDAIQDRLADHDAQIRYEALRGYLRRSVETRGCQPVYDMLDDHDTHVALEAIDAFGTICLKDEDITKRFRGEAKVPASTGPWQRETHAFVTFARRDREHAAELIEPFATHLNFWVRMYTVQAAVALDDMPRLTQLAYDNNVNVREAALSDMAQLKRPETVDAALSALEQTDVQLVRTAAQILKQAPSSKVRQASLAALLALTKEHKETSRDARLPLLELFALNAAAADAKAIEPLLKDIDPVVAIAAGNVTTQLTGKPAKVEPQQVARGWPMQYPVLRNQCVSVAMSTGSSFVLRLGGPGGSGVIATSAPITVDRFLTLALVDHYYDGLSFHRVVPNFVIQGGSPNANEYAGHQFFMRDEIGRSNARGTVGLSTRGRNTADAQIYINLVDNFRLDSGYTVFASVYGPDMPVVDAIEEGDVMQKLSSVDCPRTGG